MVQLGDRRCRRAKLGPAKGIYSVITLLVSVLAPFSASPTLLQDISLRGTLLALLNIIVIDLVLSGDNAIVIGMAVRALPAQQRRLAILFGGAAALVLRMAFTVLVTIVIRDRPSFVLAIGGVVLGLVFLPFFFPGAGEGG